MPTLVVGGLLGGNLILGGLGPSSAPLPASGVLTIVSGSAALTIGGGGPVLTIRSGTSVLNIRGVS